MIRREFAMEGCCESVSLFDTSLQQINNLSQISVHRI
jgi:hypothetical protein